MIDWGRLKETETVLTDRALLAEMGIEVWQLRSSVQPPAAQTPEHTGGIPNTAVNQDSNGRPVAYEDTSEATAPGRRPPGRRPPGRRPPDRRPPDLQPTDTRTSVPRFSLAFLHYGTFGMCVSMSTGQALPRRLCDDLARVMEADVGGLRYQQLDWPMVNSPAIDQSIDAAREVVTQKFSQLPARVLVLGSDLPAYFGPAGKFTPGEAVRIGRQSFYLVPDAVSLMNSAEDKRQLLIGLHRWRQDE